MDNNEQEKEIESGFTDIDMSETTVTGMDSNTFNLNEFTNNKDDNIGKNGGFTTEERTVNPESGKNGGFIINSRESNNKSDMNNNIFKNNSSNNFNNNSNNININNNNNNNNPQPAKVRTVVKTVKSKSSFDITNKKNLIKVAIGVIIFIVILIVLLIMLFSNSGKAADDLPKKSSKYYRICTGEVEIHEFGTPIIMEMAFGVYQSEGIPKEDVVIVWKSKKGRIKADGVEEEEEAVNSFAQYTGMTLDLGGERITNKSNYFKKGKVYITSTVEFSTDEYPNVTALTTDLQQSLKLKCK